MLNKLLGRLGLEVRAKKPTPNPADFFGRTFFQATVSPLQDARSVPAIWAMLDLIASSIAALPVMVFRRDGQGVETVDLDHPANELLMEPGAGWNKIEAIEYWIAEAARTGSSYLRILRTPDGRPMDWWPLMSGSITSQTAESGRVFYRITKQAGVIGAPANEILSADDIAILRYRMSDDGYRGLNPSWWQGQAISTGHAQAGQDESFASRGLRHGGLISVDGKLQPDTAQSLRQAFEGVFDDPRAGKMAVLDQGAKFSSLNVTPNDAQWNETRNLTIQEMARIYGVPPSAIGEVSKATFSNVEEQQRQLVRHAVMPWTHRASAALSGAFLTVDERRTMRIGFRDVDLVRGNLQDRSEYLSRMVQSGIMSRNEARELERLPPVEGGDEVLTPLNLSANIEATRSANFADLHKSNNLFDFETRALPTAVRERLRIRAMFELRFAAALEELLEEEFDRLTQIMSEDRAETRLEEFYQDEIGRQRFPSLFLPIALAALLPLRRSILNELGDDVPEDDPSLNLDLFTRAVIENQGRQFKTIRQAEAGAILELDQASRIAALDDMRANPPRSALHMTIRTVEALSAKFYEKRGRDRLALMSTGGEVLESVDVKRSGGFDQANEKILKHAPSRRFPDAIAVAA